MVMNNVHMPSLARLSQTSSVLSAAVEEWASLVAKRDWAAKPLSPRIETTFRWSMVPEFPPFFVERGNRSDRTAALPLPIRRREKGLMPSSTSGSGSWDAASDGRADYDRISASGGQLNVERRRSM
jgi:hypothetical protein